MIPSGKVFDSVKLSVDAGTIEMSASLNTDQFSVEVGAGEFTNSGDITAKLCDLQVGAGTWAYIIAAIIIPKAPN